jgi:hypothetical protein
MAVRKLGTPLAPRGVQGKNENSMRFSRGSVNAVYNGSSPWPASVVWHITPAGVGFQEVFV